MPRRIAIYMTDTWRDKRVAGFNTYAQKMKLFAVCFGHQAVAVALGGRVEAREVDQGSDGERVGEWAAKFLCGA